MIKHVDREIEEYRKLTGEKKHYCPDWDFMAIDENSPEFEACTCFDPMERVATMEVNFGHQDKRQIPYIIKDGKHVPVEITGYEFMEVLGGGWYAFRI